MPSSWLLWCLLLAACAGAIYLAYCVGRVVGSTRAAATFGDRLRRDRAAREARRREALDAIRRAVEDLEGD